MSILLGRGDGTFAAIPEVAVGARPRSITVGDFNGDSRPDLAVTEGVTVSILLGRGAGTFQAAQDFGAGAAPQSITAGDFNGDGRPDLAVADDAGAVSILLNDTPGVVVNDFVTFEPLPATFTFTPDPTGCPTGFIGQFRFEARLTNVSEHALFGLIVAVTRITQFNLLQNADGSPGGVGARLTVPRQGDLPMGCSARKRRSRCRLASASSSARPSVSRWQS